MLNIKSFVRLTLSLFALTAAQICSATTPYESKVFNASSLGHLATTAELKSQAPKRLNISLALHGVGRTNLILEKTDSQPSNSSTITYRGIRLVPHNGKGKKLGKRNVDWASATLTKEEDGVFILFSLATTNREGFTRFYRGTLKLGEDLAKIASTPQFFLANKDCEDSDLQSLALRSGAGNQLTAELTSQQWAQLKELELGIYIDSFAADKLGSKTASKTTEAVNAVSAIYERDLGIKVTLKSTFSEPAKATSAFSETDASFLLESFRDEMNVSKKLGATDASFLYTGRDIDSNIIGLAFLDSVCEAPNYSYGLFQRISDSLDYIILAHELGHTLSANHVKSGIMAAALSASAPANFSDQSKEEITSYVENFGDCLNTIVPTPTITPSPISTAPAPQPTFNSSNTDPTPPDPTPTASAPNSTSKAPAISIRGGLKGRNINIMATVSANNSSCKLSVKLGRSASTAISAKPLSDFSLSTIQTRITSSLNMRTRDTDQLFLAVEHTCPNTSPSLSNVIKLRTSAVSAKASYNSRDFLRRLKFKYSPVTR